jgi:hypothetical protein
MFGNPWLKRSAKRWSSHTAPQAANPSSTIAAHHGIGAATDDGETAILEIPMPIQAARHEGQ